MYHMHVYIYIYIYMYTYIHIYIYIYIYSPTIIQNEQKLGLQKNTLKFTPLAMYISNNKPLVIYTSGNIHPVSITRFPLRRFSPGARLLRNLFVHR